MRLSSWSIPLFLLLAACSSAPPAAEPADDCGRYRDHSIELSLRAANDLGGADLSDEVIAAHEAQMREALAAEYAVTCRQLSRAQLECGLDAETIDDLTACSGGAR